MGGPPNTHLYVLSSSLSGGVICTSSIQPPKPLLFLCLPSCVDSLLCAPLSSSSTTSHLGGSSPCCSQQKGSVSAGRCTKPRARPFLLFCLGDFLLLLQPSRREDAFGPFCCPRGTGLHPGSWSMLHVLPCVLCVGGCDRRRWKPVKHLAHP